MDCLTYALNHVRKTIPPQILSIAFQDNVRSFRKAPISIDEKIMEDVIRARVLLDADIVGGIETVIPLNNVPGQYVDDFTVMYEIPMDLTNNRRIISVKSIGYLPYAVTFSSFGAGVGTIGPSGVNDLTGAGQRVGDSVSNIPPVSEANVDLVGYNTIVVRNFRRITAAYHLRCVVSNDADLANINPRSYHVFAKLCELAVKAYIYNEKSIEIDRAFLVGGQELGSIRTWIDKQEDAEEQYQFHLHKVWRKVSVLNDRNQHIRFIKTQINPGI